MIVGRTADREVAVSVMVYTDKSFLYLVRLLQIGMVITLFQFIWYQKKFCLVPNQSK